MRNCNLTWSQQLHPSPHESLIAQHLSPLQTFTYLDSQAVWEKDGTQRVQYKFWLELQGKPANGKAEEL